MAYSPRHYCQPLSTPVTRKRSRESSGEDEAMPSRRSSLHELMGMSRSAPGTPMEAVPEYKGVTLHVRTKRHEVGLGVVMVFRDGGGASCFSGFLGILCIHLGG